MYTTNVGAQEAVAVRWGNNPSGIQRGTVTPAGVGLPPGRPVGTIGRGLTLEELIASNNGKPG